ncbi:MAG: DUF4388 domain-containing protein [Myxococcales bacterium]|nr:DUF4388 domain-containing protein [Myxococcales bacterium]MCB9704278.1 DUF4388 domain-containing protein [Myxococcales bacterium]
MSAEGPAEVAGGPETTEPTLSDAEPTSPTPALPLQGRLRETRMPALLWRLTASRATGLLKVRSDEGVEKWVWFVDGQPVFARSNLTDDRLTDRLLQRGLLSRAQYEEAQALIANKGSRRSGEVLVEAGLIPQSALDEALQEHLLHMFDSMFLWEDAAWDFDPEGRCEETVTLGRPTAAIIMGAARNRLHMHEMWAAVGHPSLRPHLLARDRAVALIEELDLLPTETIWLRRLDGTQSLAQLLGEWDTDERELISVVFVLKLLGALAME